MDWTLSAQEKANSPNPQSHVRAETYKLGQREIVQFDSRRVLGRRKMSSRQGPPKHQNKIAWKPNAGRKINETVPFHSSQLIQYLKIFILKKIEFCFYYFD